MDIKTYLKAEEIANLKKIYNCKLPNGENASMNGLRMGFKKIAVGTAFLMMSLTTSQVAAEQKCASVKAPGCGYEATCCSPCVTPYILLATVAVLSIVVLNTTHHSHAHSH